ncbi:hypothetical protein G6F43_013486 [Rhizopus delemar]|nr:hypothetical protein G6F43_013486 [Rhizopus delemar]
MSTPQENSIVDPTVTSTPESQSSMISDLSSPMSEPQGTMASKCATEPTLMDTDTATPAPRVMESNADIIKRKLQIIEALKNQAKMYSRSQNCCKESIFLGFCSAHPVTMAQTASVPT